jgi:hypothetical protein
MPAVMISAAVVNTTAAEKMAFLTLVHSITVAVWVTKGRPADIVYS